MSRFCSKYPECGCQEIGTKCYNPLVDKMAALEAALRLDGVPTEKETIPNRNRPCPCGSGKKYKHCCVSSK